MKYTLTICLALSAIFSARAQSALGISWVRYANTNNRDPGPLQLGKPNDPVRCITQVYDKEGNLIAEKDPYEGDKFVLFDLVYFGKWILENGFKAIDPGVVNQWIDSIESK